MYEKLKLLGKRAGVWLLALITAQPRVARGVFIALCALLGLMAARCALATPVGVSPVDGNYFLSVAHVTKALRSDQPDMKLAVSVYVRAVSDAGQDLVHCAGAVNADMLAELALATYADANPRANAAQLLMHAMSQKYPCGEQT